MTWSDLLLPPLNAVFLAVARASIEGGLFVLAVWLVTRAIPRLPAGARATLWWIACARFAVSLAGIAPLGVPVALPAPLGRASTTAIAPTARVSSQSDASQRPVAPPNDTDRVRETASGASWHIEGYVERGGTSSSSVSPVPTWPWTAWAGVFWLALLIVGFARLVLALRRAARAVAGATPIDAATLPAIRLVAERFDLAADPDVRISDSLGSPQLMWAGHAVVLLPSAALRAWAASNLELALAHEFAHLRRHDLAWGIGVAFVGRAFAFHPLARLAAREYGLAREAACDAEVLARTNASPFDYGKLLLALGVTRRPALSLSGAAWSGRSLKRRLVMLEHHLACRRANTRWIVIPVALVAGLVGLTAAAPGPQSESQSSQPAVATATNAPARAATGAAEPVTAVSKQTPQPPPPPPPKPTPPARPPAPPLPPAPPAPPRGAHLELTSAVADAWVFLSGDRSIQHGSRHDRRLAEGLQKGTEPLFWFAREGKEYVIRDKATLDRIDQLLAPERTLPGGQRDLAQLQTKLAEEQARVAMKQAEVASRVAAVGAKQAALGAEEAKLRAEAIADRRHQGIEDAKVHDIQTQARLYEKQIEALEAEMRTYEEQLRAFEPEQEALAREMETRAHEFEAHMERASRELQELLTKTIASGIAQVVR